MASQVSTHYRLRRRNILLGITAGVAAYKAAELARLLVKAGAQVQAVMTPSASEFIGPLTLQAVTGRPVRQALFDPQHEAAMGHIELARWADLVLIAPATADFLARLAAGMADDLLTTLCLASEAPLAVAPAMNQAMWRHPATQANIATLAARGVMFWGPAEGEQACGDNGPGRMLEPAELLQRLVSALGGSRFLGRRAVVTAGPTREPLDPVRFLGNRSSGRMGYAIAEALAREGGEVILISGPVALACPPGVERISVETALQMHSAALTAAEGADLFVACAAVADYRPASAADHKIKKDSETLRVDLVRNPDILRDVAALPDRPFCVGFAAETERLREHATGKLIDKGADMIAANPVGEGLGFESDDNALLVIWKGGSLELPRQRKGRLAEQLVSVIAERMDAQVTAQDSR
ncbi:MAG: bifunctional phosphopantothenoylcysteine decarboxylase/phosphopantothenate--cysteine ligase CoaBC [Gammaproteobacteria bacterium]|nr:MAG: bifunctional phosphopantothenoylcysteine decarboxylase/phosphopantothenate--cysteine ligase CoaBC [Gammaproteobacteria bacterium]